MDKKQLTKLLSFFVMGDGGVYMNKDNAFFAMNMKAENLDYIEWVEETLKTFVGTQRYARKDCNTDGCTRQPQIRLQSSSHPALTLLQERIYTDTYKGIDPHALKLLDWEAMAILYMCDGSLHEDKPSPSKRLVNSSWNLKLSMNRLSYGDQLLLKKAIKDVLDVEFNVTRKGRYYEMRLRSKDVEKFCRGVEPYMKPSFRYKIRMIDPGLPGGEIVCSTQRCVEVGRNDQPLSLTE